MTTKYELFLCDVSGEHKPIVKFESANPFMPVQNGERLDSVGQIASENSKKYIVHSIKHTIKEINGNLITQYWVNLHPYQGSQSSGWSEE